MSADGRTRFGSENSFERVASARAQKHRRSDPSIAEPRSGRADLRDPHSNPHGICKSDRLGFATANWHTAKTQADWVRLKPPSHPRSVEVDGRAESSGVERERPVHQPRRSWLEINLQHSGFARTDCEWKRHARSPELACTLSDFGNCDRARGGIDQGRGQRFCLADLDQSELQCVWLAGQLRRGRSEGSLCVTGAQDKEGQNG